MPRFVLVAVDVRFPLEEGAQGILGRGDDVPFRVPTKDARMSRKHLQLEVVADGVRVRDLGSTSGTQVDGVRVTEATLKPGNVLRVGNTVFRVESGDGTSRPSLASLPAAGFVFEASHTTLSHGWPCDGCGAAHPLYGSPTATYGWLCDGCAATRKSERPLDPTDPPAYGSFELIRRLAGGGMGVVYEARDRNTGAHAVVKTLAVGAKKSGAMAQRFAREQQIAWELVHPNIVLTFEAQSSKDVTYIAAEFVSGGDAKQLVKASPGDAVVLSIAADLFDALGFAHRRGVVHRDVKPENLLVRAGSSSRPWLAKLADFGLAKHGGEAGASPLTETGDVLGTVAYMAPEQWIGFKETGRGADLYSAAITAYELITNGNLPVALPRPRAACSSADWLRATLADARTPLATHRPDVPPALAHIFDTLVARDPEKRVAVDATEVAAHLRSYSAWAALPR